MNSIEDDKITVVTEEKGTVAIIYFKFNGNGYDIDITGDKYCKITQYWVYRLKNPNDMHFGWENGKIR